MVFLLCIATVFLFPAAAMWAWQRGGGRRLALLTAASTIALVGLALLAASPLGGNRLAATEGYAFTAFHTLLIVGLQLILPLVASAIIVWATSTRVRPMFVYTMAAATAFIGQVAGVFLAVFAVWS